jgi:hypothetical protein
MMASLSRDHNAGVDYSRFPGCHLGVDIYQHAVTLRMRERVMALSSGLLTAVHVLDGCEDVSHA